MKMDQDDSELLSAYAKLGSEAAFAELVERHAGLVFSAARRQLGDNHLAEDVCQQVFALLANKAPQLDRRTVLAGWLYRTALHIAHRTRRGERRRILREFESSRNMSELTPSAQWEEIEPILDEAMATLDDTDRSAIVLRFFEDQPLRAVARVLGVSDDAAQKRVARALVKLRNLLADRGVVVSAGALAVSLPAHAAKALPAGGLGNILKFARPQKVARSALAKTLGLFQSHRLAVTMLAGAAIGVSIWVLQPPAMPMLQPNYGARPATVAATRSHAVAEATPFSFRRQHEAETTALQKLRALLEKPGLVSNATEEALRLIGSLGAQKRAGFDLLIEFITTERPARGLAAVCLQAFPDWQSEAVQPLLNRISRSTDVSENDLFSSLLGNFHVDCTAFADELATIMAQNPAAAWGIRELLERAVSDQRLPADATVNRVKPLLGSQDLVVRLNAAALMARLRAPCSDDLLAPVLAGLSSFDFRAQDLALSALNDLGAAAQSAASAVCDLARHQPQWAKLAANTLSRISPDMEDEIARLRSEAQRQEFNPFE